MLHWLYKNCLPFFLILSFFFFIICSSQESYGQGFYKITDKIGGSGSASQSGGTDNSSSTLIIVGAAVIAGFLVYKLVIDKDKPIKETKKDTTSNDESLLYKKINKSINNTDFQIEKYRQIPLNFYAGIERSNFLISERKLILGITYNF